MHVKSLTYWCLFLAITADWSAVALQHSWGHDVGEPALEKLPVWKQCCGDGDCIPQHLQVIGKKPGKISVEIEGVQTSVDKEKFSPVPSDRTWVCYVHPGGAITDDNIRCILHPQKGGTT
jgi:hypothetical protein